MKKTIWQKVDRRIARIKIFRNTAKIIINRISTDTVTGTTSVDREEYAIVCSEPQTVTASVNLPLVQQGDLAMTIDYLEMRDIFEHQNVGLAWNENSGILTPGTDEIEFAGVVYGIRSVTPQDWQNNQPGQYVIVLKGVAAAGEA